MLDNHSVKQVCSVKQPVSSPVQLNGLHLVSLLQQQVGVLRQQSSRFRHVVLLGQLHSPLPLVQQHTRVYSVTHGVALKSKEVN